VAAGGVVGGAVVLGVVVVGGGLFGLVVDVCGLMLVVGVLPRVVDVWQAGGQR
jgi:hypothetical protein